LDCRGKLFLHLETSLACGNEPKNPSQVHAGEILVVISRQSETTESDRDTGFLVGKTDLISRLACIYYMRELFSDGWNSIAHVAVGFAGGFRAEILLLFVIYQLVTPDDNTPVDLAESLAGACVSVLGRKIESSMYTQTNV
jgi:hypothetical protein